MFTPEQVDRYLKQAGCVTWGRGFDVSKEDTRKLAVDWFLKQTEKIKDYIENPELDLKKKIELYTPTGSIRVYTTVDAVLNGIQYDAYVGSPYHLVLPEFGLRVRPVDESLRSVLELKWYLTLNDKLEVCRA